MSPFQGKPWSVYVPARASWRVTATTELELAVCSAPGGGTYSARLIGPDQVGRETRGTGTNTRHVANILPEREPAHSLLVVEVVTPAGNWSSYPPHKHDVHNLPVEADLEELYYYRIDRPEGYAIQKVYTRDKRLDYTLTVRDGEMVRVPEGYHPVVAAHGYNVYYLNALAGSARSMAASDDPDYEWVRSTWHDKDPRVPLVTMEMETIAATQHG
jgi:5-deoxy-glucuronate isomerase